MKLAHDQDKSYAQISNTFGISRMSVYRRLKGHIEAKKESETHCLNNQKSLALGEIKHILITTIVVVLVVGCRKL